MDNVSDEARTAQMTDETRDRLLHEVGGFLAAVGWSMRVTAEKSANTSVLAVATCIQINGELARGVRDLITERNYYAAASVGRQILETTQLVQYFTAAPDRAAFWLTASDEEVRKAADLRPRNLRAATGASDTTYGLHCLLGGHPRSVARRLLPGGAWNRDEDVVDLTPAGFNIQTSLRSLLLCDSLQHLYDAVLATLGAVDDDVFKAVGALEERSFELTGRLVEGLLMWRKTDPLAMVGSDGN